MWIPMLLLWRTATNTFMCGKHSIENLLNCDFMIPELKPNCWHRDNPHSSVLFSAPPYQTHATTSSLLCLLTPLNHSAETLHRFNVKHLSYYTTPKLRSLQKPPVSVWQCSVRMERHQLFEVLFNRSEACSAAGVGSWSQESVLFCAPSAVSDQWLWHRVCVYRQEAR